MRFYLPEQSKNVSMEEAFPFLRERGHICSFVGAGGKTTLVYAFARAAAEYGVKTAVMTTTHMMQPAYDVWAGSETELQSLWDSGVFAVLGQACADGKMTVPLDSLRDWTIREADLVFVEADGSKRLPCKVPAMHEPVILPESDVVVGVVGVSALGKRLSDVCFRAKEAMALLGVDSDHCLMVEDLCQILLSERGTRKNVGSRVYYIVVSQCNDDAALEQGRKLAQCIRERNAEVPVVLCGLECNSEGL